MGSSPTHFFIPKWSALVAQALGRAVPGAQLSMDVPVRPISYGSQSQYDYVSLGKCVDYYVAMAYDMQTPDSARTNITAPNSPIDLVRSGLAEFSAIGIPMAKLVLAQPFFGYVYRCQSVLPPAKGTSCVPEPPFVVDPSGFNYEVGLNTIYGSLLPLSSSGVRPTGTLLPCHSFSHTNLKSPCAEQGPEWNETAQSPWFDYVNHTDGERRRVPAPYKIYTIYT